MELHVDPPVSEPELSAIRRALDPSATSLEAGVPAERSAWSHTAALEATDREPADECYAPSPRRTRGATRA